MRMNNVLIFIFIFQQEITLRSYQFFCLRLTLRLIQWIQLDEIA